MKKARQIWNTPFDISSFLSFSRINGSCSGYMLNLTVLQFHGGQSKVQWKKSDTAFTLVDMTYVEMYAMLATKMMEPKLKLLNSTRRKQFQTICLKKMVTWSGNNIKYLRLRY